MKKLISILVLFTFVLTIFAQNISQAWAQQSNRYSMAVLNLTIRSGDISRSEVRLLTGRLTEELSRGGLFYTMNQSDMERGLMVKNFDPSACETIDCAVQYGRALGVQLVVVGSIEQTGPVHSIKLDMVHVATREIVKSHQDVYDGSFTELLEKAPLIASQFVGQPLISSQNRSRGNARRSSTPTYNKSGGFKWYYLGLGLLIAGGAGAGIILATKDSKDGGSTTTTTNPTKLPGPPTFP
ncbi:MAG: hypothetical protein ACE5HS_16765 [bacterium]